jgi:hypothetical protein
VTVSYATTLRRYVSIGMGVFPATATPLLEQTAKGGSDKQRRAKRQLALPMRQLPLPAAVDEALAHGNPSDFAFAFIRGALFKLGCKRLQASGFRSDATLFRLNATAESQFG